MDDGLATFRDEQHHDDLCVARFSVSRVGIHGQVVVAISASGSGRFGFYPEYNDHCWVDWGVRCGFDCRAGIGSPVSVDQSGIWPAVRSDETFFAPHTSI